MDIIFPDDFALKTHPVIPGSQQWLWEQPMNMPEPPVDKRVKISVVGGGMGFHGDGVKTFEMWDFREDEPRGYLTKDEINDHLRKHPC